MQLASRYGQAPFPHFLLVKSTDSYTLLIFKTGFGVNFLPRKVYRKTSRNQFSHLSDVGIFQYMNILFGHCFDHAGIGHILIDNSLTWKHLLSRSPAALLLEETPLILCMSAFHSECSECCSLRVVISFWERQYAHRVR